MDWETALTTIVSASAFLKKPIENAFTKAVLDGYGALRRYVEKRFEKEYDVIDALGKVEAKPESQARQQVLLEELQPHDVASDPELISLLKMLEKLLEQAGAPTERHVNITQSGSRNRLNYAEGDINVVENKILRPNVQPNETHITEDQATQINEKIVEISKIDEKAGKGSSYQELYGVMRKMFRCTSYKMLPVERFDDVVNWLNQEAGKRTRSLRRSNNDEWRTQKYRVIHAARKTLEWSDSEVKEFAANEFGLKAVPKSLKELKERQLDKLAEKLRYRSRRK
ncbi:hypothetical protein SH580_17130 [Coraliomargarita algicola]|uniref:Uncharacterized protein n=1 Tax=Coraliomargarita algicola TaxID=3092156 RepID=A0ABZ0RK38_9BACT|nr:hypothetical protein [Coraliomargarita sp. J2-16]WPJ95150.1 hypothetical protein SH580_17130 [Coraliomargarita sp. J2-16]